MRMLLNIKDNNGTVLLMTLLILSGILVVALGAASLVTSGIMMSRAQERSTKAYFAAEAGAERALWEVRKNNYAAPDQDQENVFSETLGNGASYSVDYATSSPNIYFTSNGSYRALARSVKIGFVKGEGGGPCVPDCGGKLCGADDGCGGTCPATCSAVPGCRVSAPSNSGVAAGSCCAGDCYECLSGYQWNGLDCVLPSVPCDFDFIFPCVF